MEDKKPKQSKNEELSVEQADKNNKPLNLAFIGKALFVHLAKKQKANIFAILMQNIEYQRNKTIKPLINPKSVVPEK